MAASSASCLGDVVAQTTLDLYASLSSSSPTDLPIKNGALEWTVLSSVSLVLPASAQRGSTPRVVPISLGTGTKTTPYESLKGTPGDVLHDLHAEVLARRGARRWIAQRVALEAQWHNQCDDSGNDGHVELDGLPLLLRRDRNSRLWRFKEEIKVWWYVSTLPCGECSTSHLERRRAREYAVEIATVHNRRCGDAAAAAAAAGCDRDDASTSHATSVLRGRQIVYSPLPRLYATRPRLRTVPGRPDAPPSLCHSCTDKLLLWSLIGWQGAALSRLLIGKLPIDGLVIGVTQTDMLEEDAARALAIEIGKGLDVRERCDGTWYDLQRQVKEEGLPIDLVPPPVLLTSLPFSQSQESVRSRAHEKGVRIEAPTIRSMPSVSVDNESDSRQVIALIPAWDSSSYIRPCSALSSVAAPPMRLAAKSKLEKLVYGIKQGASPKRHPLASAHIGYPPLHEKRRSRLCKLDHLLLLRDICKEFGMGHAPGRTYADFKGKRCEVQEQGETDEWYRRAKSLLRGERFGHRPEHWQVASERERHTTESWLHRVTYSVQPRGAVDEGSIATDVPATQEGDIDLTARAADTEQSSRAPLQGWLITPRSLEDFDCEGSLVV